MSVTFWILTGESSVWPDKMTCGICSRVNDLNLKQKIVHFTDGLLKYLAKKCVRPGLAYIKPGLTNAGKNYLQACKQPLVLGKHLS